MNREDDLPPLDGADSEAPEALRRALRALGRQQPSAAALQASALRLEARLDGPLPGVPELLTPGARPTSAALAGKLGGGRLLIAALAVGLAAGAIALRPSEPPAQPQHATVVTPHVSPAPAAEAQDEPATASDPPTRAQAPVTREALPNEASTTAAQAPARAVLAPDPARSRTSPSDTAARPLPRGRKLSTQTSASKTPLAQTEPLLRTGSAAAPEGSDSSAPTQQEARAVASASELELLLQARKLAQTDPAAALQTLAEHARRFPRGLLAPEREVLAIEALRALGRDNEAEQRLARFRAAYPASMHTPGLSKHAR